MTVNWVDFEMIEELIAKVGGLFLKGKSCQKKPKVLDKNILWKLFCPKEEPLCMWGGFSGEDLPKLWDIVCYAIMHYITLEYHF